MESILGVILQSGNVVAIVAFIVCYLVIYFQRKSTSEKRNVREQELQAQIDAAKAKAEAAERAAKQRIEETQEELEDKIAQFNTDKQLMQKDITYLLEENSGIKEDIKEMKTTLNQMAISLAKIAAKYDKG